MSFKSCFNVTFCLYRQNLYNLKWQTLMLYSRLDFLCYWSYSWFKTLFRPETDPCLQIGISTIYICCFQVNRYQYTIESYLRTFFLINDILQFVFTPPINVPSSFINTALSNYQSQPFHGGPQLAEVHRCSSRHPIQVVEACNQCRRIETNDVTLPPSSRPRLVYYNQPGPTCTG